jgi:hypothetical protein
MRLPRLRKTERWVANVGVVSVPDILAALERELSPGASSVTEIADGTLMVRPRFGEVDFLPGRADAEATYVPWTVVIRVERIHDETFVEIEHHRSVLGLVLGVLTSLLIWWRLGWKEALGVLVAAVCLWVLWLVWCTYSLRHTVIGIVEAAVPDE